MYSPQDILFLVLAFCALWLTVFLCWLLWQVAVMLRRVNETAERVEDALTGMRKKFESVSLGAIAVGEGLKRVVEIALDRRDRKKQDDGGESGM